MKVGGPAKVLEDFQNLKKDAIVTVVKINGYTKLIDVRDKGDIHKNVPISKLKQNFYVTG